MNIQQLSWWSLSLWDHAFCNPSVVLFPNTRPAKIGLIYLSAVNNLEYLELSIPTSNSVVNKVVNSFLFLQLRE